MKIGEVLDGVYDDEVGWRPATGAIKPVHVANGLARAATGEYYDTSQIIEFVVWWKQGKIPDDDRSYERLVLERHPETYGYFAESKAEFERARKYALGLLNADNAVYPSAEHSALTLTCREMASRFHGDQHLGEFGAAILHLGKADTLRRAFLEALDVNRPDDPLTTIVWPLLQRTGKADDGIDNISKTLQRRHHRACLREFESAAETLAGHEAQQGNRLRTLERVVQLVCLATHAHAQALASGGDLNARTPLLMALTGEKRSELAVASEFSLEAMYTGFESWLIDQAAARIRSSKPLSGAERLDDYSADGRTARRILRGVLSAKKPHNEPDQDTLDARMEDFEEAKRLYGKDDPARLMAHALVRSYLREFESGGPRSFLQGLGRKVGLLYPHFQGNSRDKRIRPSVPILDLLVRTCTQSKTLVPLDQFLSRLWCVFGLVVGGRLGDGGDSELLSRYGIEVDPAVLVTNTNALVDLLAQMGLARRLADNVTFVGDGYAT